MYNIYMYMHSLTISAGDRTFWKQTRKFALDTYGLSAHGP